MSEPPPAPPSPTSSVGSDDAFNTTFAHVHFGPVRSPKKKLRYTIESQAGLELAQLLPLRRSPRLSNIAATQPEENEHGTEGNDASDENRDGEEDELFRPTTPEQDHAAYDEPPSLLASRILRAQDNPSPPPMMSEAVAPHLNRPLVDISDPSSPSPYVPAIDDDTELPHLRPPRLLANAPTSPSPLRASLGRDQLQGDLISFNSFDLLPVPSPLNQPPSGISSDSAAEEAQVAGDLLSLSPLLKTFVSPAEEHGSSNGSDVSQWSSDAHEDKFEGKTAADANGQPEAPLYPDETSQPEPAERPLRRSPRRSIPASSPVPRLVAQGSTVPPSQANEARNSAEDANARQDPVAQVLEQNNHAATPSPALRRLTQRQAPNRVLDSLSPGSSTVLSQLISSNMFSVPEEGSSGPSEPVAGPSTPQSKKIPATPVRFPSPSRKSRPESPTKFSFQPSPFRIVNSSPPRRVPVNHTSVQNRGSPAKHKQGLWTRDGRQLGAPSGAPVFSVPADHSPRKVPLAGPSSVATTTNARTPAGSSVASSTFRRAQSVEPASSPKQVKGKQRSGSEEPPRFGSSLLPKGRSNLPTPQRSDPAGFATLPFPLVASSRALSFSIPEEEGPSEVPQEKPAPKSQLKQPSSRIPRIGSKPYARPTASVRSKAAEPKATTTPSNVRKIDFTGAKPSVPKSKQAPKRTANFGVATTAASKPTAGSQAGSQNEVVSSDMEEAQCSSSQRNTSANELQTSSDRRSEVTVSRLIPDVRVEVTQGAQDPELEASPDGLNLTAHQQPPEIPEPALVSDTEPLNVRRTTRSRKPVNYAIPSNSSIPETRPATRRKQTPFPPLDSGPFSGMTATALRALTNSNTEKNQRYVFATLETQVVRKDGPRPESPVMKASQRAKDPVSQQRKERARRRARRSGEGSSDVDELAEEDELDQDEAEAHLRHKRGAGETEDYTTPARPGKRARFNIDENDDSAAAQSKRVKWDRGLLTEVFVDEILPRTNARPKDGVSKKGCLAPTAKALQLDTLGNLPNAESPLKNMEQENIVVQKFVYDDEVPSSPVVVVPKTTRARSKKSKS